MLYCKNIKELLEPVYFHIAYKHWELTEHNLGHCKKVGSTSGSFLLIEEGLDLSFAGLLEQMGLNPF